MMKWLRRKWHWWRVSRHECVFCSRSATMAARWSVNGGRTYRSFACQHHESNLLTHVKSMSEV